MSWRVCCGMKALDCCCCLQQLVRELYTASMLGCAGLWKLSMTGALCTRLSSMCSGVVCPFDAHVLGQTSAHAHPYASQLFQVLDARLVFSCAVLSDGASVALLCQGSSRSCAWPAARMAYGNCEFTVLAL